MLYERAIECAASERWAAVLNEEEEARFAAAEASLRGFWEDYLGFQVGGVRRLQKFELKSPTDGGKGDATLLDRPCTKSD